MDRKYEAANEVEEELLFWAVDFEKGWFNAESVPHRNDKGETDARCKSTGNVE